MNRSILIVDDDEHIREIAQLTLEALAGWTVATAGSGREGIARAHALPPDAILLDVQMPEMDGPTTVGRLKASDTTRHIPVVLLTAKVLEEDKRGFEELGIDGIISKPFDPMTLADQISNALGWA
jgi:CheY-like chemotaxis protein